jgi:RHS repeat-associated protein
VAQPLRLQGQYWDEETGLHYNRWRYYDPGIGAFVSQDPLGLAAGENVYGFGANAQGWIDPLGLACEKPNQYVRKNLPELTGTTKEAFTDGNYKLRTFKAGERVHRSPWVPDELPENPGSWLSTRKTVTKIGTESSSNIAKWGNPIEKLRTYEFTQDTTVYYGKVAGGTGYQALIPADVKPGNVLKFVREVNLK